MTPEPVDALVEQVREGIAGDEDDPTMWVQAAYAALTDLAERVKAAEAEAERLRDLRFADVELLETRAEAAEESARVSREVAQSEAADADHYKAQRDELVEALKEIARIDSPFGHSRGIFRDIARAALAKVRGEAE